MKTKILIDGLWELRANPERAKDYKWLLSFAAERLEELSSGEASTEAELSKKKFTIHELALMNDELKKRIRELEKTIRTSEVRD